MEALNEQMADMKARGLLMSDEDRQLAVEAEGAFLSLSLAMSRISQVIAAAVTPAFLEVMDVLQSVVEQVVTFIDNNRSLVMWITGGVVAIGALGIVLMGLGAVCIGASLATTGLTMALTALSAVVAFLTSPLFIITAAIVACGIAALVSAYYLDQLFNGGAALNFLRDAALAAWDAITLLWTAIANGRWDLAGQLIGNGLAAGFYGAILMIKQAWLDMTVWLVETIAAAVAKIENALPEWITKKLGFSAKVEGLAAGIRGSGETALAADRNAAAESAMALLDTVASINGLNETIKADRAAKAGLADFGSVSDFAKQSSILSGSVGATISSNAARLGFAAPANSIDEKQLDVLQQIKGGVDDMIDGIDQLEGLTAD
jgi:hypothetical protein